MTPNHLSATSLDLQRAISTCTAAVRENTDLLPGLCGLSLQRLASDSSISRVVCLLVDQAHWRGTTLMSVDLAGVALGQRHIIAVNAAVILNAGQREARATGSQPLMVILQARPGAIDRAIDLQADEIALVAAGPGDWAEVARDVHGESIAFTFEDESAGAQVVCSVAITGEVALDRRGLIASATKTGRRQA